jgi:hypothetical protein
VLRGLRGFRQLVKGFKNGRVRVFAMVLEDSVSIFFGG